ncbi:interleukin-6 [Macrotis lagotis]|uniref:interleukin-6 n=1 Tax=Macrotis lagotis TaxID=92651 RepID=UPI003D69F400
MNPLLPITGSLRPLALTLTLLLATAALPIPDPSGNGFSGDVVPSKSTSHYSNLHKAENLAELLRRKADDLKKQMCKNQNMCDNSNEVLAENHLNLPNITEEDGCFQNGFNEETCLIKIVSGLQDFDTYLQYIETKDNTFQPLKLTTEQLVLTLKPLIKMADAVPTPNPTASKELLFKLKSLKGWMKDVSLHLILRHYVQYMERTIRAVRYLNPRSLHA